MTRNDFNTTYETVQRKQALQNQLLAQQQYETSQGEGDGENDGDL